jgi:tetratricopeptide (TPR) repeat protein
MINPPFLHIDSTESIIYMDRYRYTSAWSALVFLFLLILIIYSNTFDAAWHLDDYQNITQNPHFQKIEELDISKLWASLHSPVTQRISRPVVMLSLAFNWYIGSNDVFGYHVVNLLIHLLTAFILYLSILNLFKAPNLKERYQDEAGFIALLATVLWTIHPIQTQAITYIVQRMAGMAAMFYILSLFCFIKARLEPIQKYRYIFFFCCGLNFLLGVGSKENAATLPIALGLIEVLFFQDLNDRRTRKICLVGLICGAIIIFVSGAVLFLNGNPTALLRSSGFRLFSPLERLMTEARVVVFYLSQIFYPVISRYSIEHDIVVSTSFVTPWTTLPAIILVFSLIGLGLSQMRKRPILSLAILFFFLNHLIESSIIPLELVFEHRNYLPSFFVFLPLAVGVKWLLDYYRQRSTSFRFILISFVTILLILLGTGTYIRNRAWASERSLWEDAAKKAPGSNRPLHNLAWAYYERIGEYDTALRLYHAALNRQMNNTAQKALILNNMAGIHFQQGRFHKATELWQAAVIAFPKYGATKYRLALAREKLGQTQEALVLLDEILSKYPDYSDALMLKAAILLKQGQLDEALSYFKKCLSQNPFEKKVLSNIGIAYNLKGQYGRAAWFFKILHNRFPQDRLCLLWLIETNLKSGDTLELGRYTNKLLSLIRIDEINPTLTKLAGAGLMDSLSRELVLRQISKRLAERTEDVLRQSL